MNIFHVAEDWHKFNQEELKLDETNEQNSIRVMAVGRFVQIDDLFLKF